MCYTYDELSRVTKRTIKNLSNAVLSEESYSYDAAGNVTGSCGNTAFTYDINNRLTAYNGDAVSYDQDGNMLSAPIDCLTTAFSYDSANRLVSAGCHTYTYNAEDVRIRNSCEDYNTTYTYNTVGKLSQLLTKTTNGNVTKYVYGLGLIGEEKQGCFKTYHFDYRGSTVAITDASGNITDTFQYDTYGKLLSRTGTSFVIFGYNGRDGVITDKNGLIYMRARYYAPELRRFVNADIVPGEISNAVTLNRYAYANGNPVSNIDPFGLSVDKRWNGDEIGYSWQELGFAYDGSMHDFRRLEQGLPPYAYEIWLKNGYGYSDDPYWDAILGNYDAIYACDYSSPYGLPVAGHAYLLLKDKHGDWIKTEFTGSFPDKSTAKVYKSAYSSHQKQNINRLIDGLSIPLKSIDFLQDETQVVYVGTIPVVLTVAKVEHAYTDGVQFMPLKGDFSKSIDLIEDYKGTNYGGYNLVTNNCLHYVQELLKAGSAYNSKIEEYIETSNEIVPRGFYEGLYRVSH